MKTIDFNDWLRRHKIYVFKLSTAAIIIGKSKKYTQKFLSNNRFVKKLQNGLYYTDNANEYEVASNIIYPSYIGLISALRYRNLTEQMPSVIYVISLKQHKSIKSLNGYEIVFKKIKKSLMYGYERKENVFVSTPEKTIIDILYFKRFKEYAEDVIEQRNFERKKLIDYLKMVEDKDLVREARGMLHDYR